MIPNDLEDFFVAREVKNLSEYLSGFQSSVLIQLILRDRH